MLRAKPTRIGLEARDLHWHRGRADKRQEERIKAETETKVSSTARKRASDRAKNFVIHEDPSDESLFDFDRLHISGDQAQRGSTEFWNNILVETGSPTRAREIAAQNARYVVPSDEILDSNRSSKASVASSNSNSEESEGGTADSHRSRSSTVVKRKDLQKHLGVSLGLIHSTERIVDKDLPRTSQRRSSKTRIKERVAGLLRRPGAQVDGPSDKSAWTPDTSEGSASTFEDNHVTRANIQGPRRSDSVNWTEHVRAHDSEGSANVQSEGGSASPRNPSSLRGDASPFTPSSQSNEHIRLRTTETQQQHHQQVLGTPGSGLLSLPPRRRHRAYRPRSESYPYQISDEHSPSSFSQFDGLGASPADMEGRSLPRRRLEPSEGMAHRESRGNAASPSSHDSSTSLRSLEAVRDEVSDSDSNSQNVRVPSYSSYRSASAVSIESVQLIRTPPAFRSVPHNGTIHPSLSLPPPFSSTRRILSSTIALPSPHLGASPPAPETSPSQRQFSTTLLPSSLIIPNTPSNPSQRLPSTHSHPSPFSQRSTSSRLSLGPPAPPSTPTPQFSVYNDALPASSQPQTPADLHSRHLEASRHLFSAPPRMAGRWPSWTQPAEFATAAGPPSTPSRSRVGQGNTPGVRGVLRGMRNEEVENAGSVTPDERAARRARGMGLGLGWEEVERSSGGL